MLKFLSTVVLGIVLGFGYITGTHTVLAYELGKALQPTLRMAREINRPIAEQDKPATVRHPVQRGEYLSKIARRYGVALSSLVEANRAAYPSLAKDPNLIHPEWILVIPTEISSPEKSVMKKQNASPEKAVTAAREKHRHSPALPGVIAKAKTATKKATGKSGHGTSKALINRAIRIYERYGGIILKASEEIKVPKKYICGTIIQESGGNPDALGDHKVVKGKRVPMSHGIMQIHRPTRIKLGLSVKEALTPEIAIPAGTQLLREHYEKFGGIARYAISAYNSPGITAGMLRRGQDPGSRTYVRSVLANASACEQAERLLSI